MLDDAWLDDLAAGFFGAVCASAAHVASRTSIADRTTGDLKSRFENIAPPMGHKRWITKLSSLAVQRVWMQLARLRRLSFLFQFIYGEGPEPVRKGKAVRCAAKYTIQSYILQQQDSGQ
ncbi:MAG: hypothetical protein WA672_21085 [Candidatus Angelobacter sp.]